MRWSIVRPLSSGGNGDLFLGRASNDPTPVVIKFLREAHLPKSRQAFDREVRLLRRRLAGFVPICDANTMCERPFYVMPYFDGGTLAQYAGRLTGGQLGWVAVELARALVTLHASLEAHGDVKPDNILVDRSGKMLVADPLGNGTAITMLFSRNCGGTPGYMAPEIAAGGNISQAGDVYSYSATLFHLMTGRRPVGGRAISLPTLAYSMVPRVAEAVAAGCQANPAARPTMREMVRILRGENWAAIRASKRQSAAALAWAVGLGLAVLAVADAA